MKNKITYNELAWKQQETYHNIRNGIGDCCDVLLSPDGVMVGLNTQSRDYNEKLFHYEKQGFRVVH